MPYIKNDKREKIAPMVMALMKTLEDRGDYNYAISLLIHTYIQRKGMKYKNLNDAVGILECAKQEFIRTVITPYENKKREENGEVSDLDVKFS